MTDSLLIKGFELGYQYGNGSGSDLLVICVVIACLIIGCKAIK